MTQDIDFTKPWEYSDIKLKVENKLVYANKLIFCMWSPVFRAMFSKNFKEKDAEEIELPGKFYDAILQFCKVVHPPCSEINGSVYINIKENVHLLLPLVQEYQMDNLIERCEQYLLSESASVQNYIIGEKFNLNRLKESCLGYMKRCPTSRLLKEGFNELDEDFKVNLLIEKCEKYEKNTESLREIRMVIERKKPTTFPGMEILCDECKNHRENQVDCGICLKNCCKKLADILKIIDR
ncbi:DgyrCDS9673 [Dimorphilus gyrociliatus]|uniref:DgyrCDS9673 n=1 Tax=Dimorphilus gyrociliatus TaxID=2664684 RepID=A0A7I8W0D8_9ANNE|nr:DgyrCDS9673 [Dimorphilus gyrociliatus]